METTVIAHFFNEEILLPFWLSHHKKLFKNGVLINYASTDNSVKIIQEITPEWKIVDSKHKYFSTDTIDDEVREIEQGISGWKMVLNITEFLLCPKNDLDQYLQSHPTTALQTQGMIMVDRPEERNKEFTPGIPLLLQRTFGIMDTTNHIHSMRGRCRIIHCQSYTPAGKGRHFPTTHIFQVNDLFTCWFGWGIWITKDRKKQWIGKIPEEEVNCHYHFNSDNWYDEIWQEELTYGMDLSNIPYYKQNLDYLQRESNAHNQKPE